jgi:organic radical activating enzyme
VADHYAVVDGKIQTVKCEVNIVEHCNLSCRSCSHLSPAMPRRSIDPSPLHNDLTILARHYRARWLRLLGGEPLLHRDILGVIEAARQSGVADAICVVTNGVLLPRMTSGFWRAVDRVEISQYPGYELSADQQRACQEKAQAAGATIELQSRTQFRESYSEYGIDDMKVVQAIYDTCLVVHDWRCHTVADGRFYKCPQSYLLPKVISACLSNQVTDSIPIKDTEDFGVELLGFLQSSQSLQTCGHCLGTTGRQFTHVQTKRAKFRDLQYRPVRELIDPDFLKGAGS